MIFFFQVVAKNSSAVLVIVTVDAEILPIGTVRRVIHVVSVFVMDGQEVTVLVPEFSSALGAYEPVNPERLLPVIFRYSACPLQFSYNVLYRFPAVFLPARVLCPPFRRQVPKPFGPAAKG